ALAALRPLPTRRSSALGEFQLSDAAPTPSPPHRTLASLSTHDTETTTAWMRAAHDPRTLECLLGQLGASRAEIVVTALDDLWGRSEEHTSELQSLRHLV